MMHLERCHSFRPSLGSSCRRGLAVLAVLGLAAMPGAQALPPLAPPAPVVLTSDLPADQALALDKRILADATTKSEIMANLTHLSDVIGPRLTGSERLKRANEWAAEKMRGYGLSNVRLEPWEIPLGWQRGNATARLVEPNNGRSLIVASAAWTPGTKGKIEGDVVVLKVEKKEDFAKYKGKLKNAIVLTSEPASARMLSGQMYQNMARGSPAGGPARDGQAARGDGRGRGRGNRQGPAEPQNPNAGTGRPFGGEQFRRMMGLRREMAEFLRSEGAAVSLRDSGKPHGLLTMTGSWRGFGQPDTPGSGDRVDSREPLPSLFVAHEDYALLYRLATRPAPAKTRVAVEISNQFIDGPITCYNTVGEIPGKDKPDEYVVVGAHLDSWDLAQGTTDNGTGSSIVLETARVLMHCGTQPRRTVRFVLFTGEEQGLHGSREFCKRHKDEMARTSLCLVHDTGTGKVTGLGLQGRKVLLPTFQNEMASLKELGVADINVRGMGGSDHASFESAGVPGFAFQQDMSEYGFTHHTQTDTLDKAREPNLIQGAQAMAVTAMRVANLSQLLPRTK